MTESDLPLSTSAEATAPSRDMEKTPEIRPQPDESTSAVSTPRRHVDSRPIHTDSLVSIPLTDPDTTRPSTFSTFDDNESITDDSNVESPMEDMDLRRRSSLEMFDSFSRRSRALSTQAPPLNLAEEIDSDKAYSIFSPARSSLSEIRSRGDSVSSEGSAQVDWEQLDKTEAQDADADDDEQTALLLARLEQENNALAYDPKSNISRIRSESRPPSLHRIKRLVQEQGARSVRFSLLPAAAPMTELDFWAALVRDYLQTAQRLPTVTSNKIRGGIPAPLRGVVWVSMAGARDADLEDQFDKLSGESSPYENMINKDIGRSFPGVEMFKDPTGEGQKMLAQVLKCFSLYDDKIGYCQGLGFLVGPLLMNMGDKAAFCVLVRLMEDYDLRSCFLPDLSGLHLRIFQFQKLLQQHVPAVSTHLEALGVEGTYLSQWFLSFFAVTCPLPLLFRIYDVIFAEGASETLMRVALAVMKRNEKKLLGFTELEEAMQLLLSRQLWDPYGLNATSADELVGDFVSFTSVVTRESLNALEAEYQKEQAAQSKPISGVQAGAARFLGRLWTSSANAQPKGNTLSVSAPPRPTSSLLRTPSKQSLATLASIEGSSDGSMSTTSTALTEMSRESSADFASFKSQKSPDSMASSMRMTISSRQDKDLHGQIEDLLTALSEMQRDHSLLVAQLQTEREERAEDHKFVGPLVHQLKQSLAAVVEKEPVKRARSLTNATPPEATLDQLHLNISDLVGRLDARMSSTNNRRVSGHETKSQLRLNLATVKNQLHEETSRSHILSRQLAEKDQELSTSTEELSRARRRIQEGHIEKQRLEKTVYDLRQAQRVNRSRSGSQGSSVDPPSVSRSDTGNSEASTNHPSGLREFRLLSKGAEGRAQPTFSKRTSSLSTQAVLSTDHHQPPSEDALLLELVHAKTAEAVAKQELEEMRAKFEAMRKMFNLSPGSPSSEHSGAFRKLDSRGSDHTTVPTVRTPDGHRATPPATATAPGGGLGGFFGWGKRSVTGPSVTVESR